MFYIADKKEIEFLGSGGVGGGYYGDMLFIFLFINLAIGCECSFGRIKIE